MAVRLMGPYEFTALLALETAHVVSPFTLAGVHRGLREVVLERPLWYIASPVAVFAVGMIIGMQLSVQSLIAVYLVANLWHFSMQNYGVLQLFYSWGGRVPNFLVAFAGTTVGMIFAPLMTQILHWVTDIWLSQRVAGSRRWLLLAIVFGVAPMALLWNKTPWTLMQVSPPAVIVVWAKAFVVFRYSLSLAHFTSSAKFWKLSNPKIRAAIGHDLIPSCSFSAPLVSVAK